MKLFLLVLTFINLAFANDFVIDKLEVDCKGYECKRYGEKIESLLKEKTTANTLRRNIKFLLNESELKGIKYIVFKENNRTILSVSYEVKPIIQRVRTLVEGDIDFSFIDELVNIREGDVFSQKKINSTINTIENSLTSEGSVNAKVTYNYTNNDGRINLIFKVNSGRFLNIKDVIIQSNNKSLQKFLSYRTRFLINSKYKISKYKENIANIVSDLKSSGYYNMEVNTTARRFLGRDVVLYLSIPNDDLFSISIRGVNHFTQNKMRSFLKEVIARYGKKIDSDKLKAKLVELYQEKGFYNTKYSILIQNYKNTFDETVTNVKVTIAEGDRTTIKRLLFRNNYFFSSEYLTNYFYDKAPDMINSGYFKDSFINEFSKFIKEEYLLNGFVLVNISKPKINFSKDKRHANVSYIIKEGPRAFIEEINFKGIEEEIEAKIQKVMKNKVTKEFNPLVMQADLESVLQYVKEQGYYNATLDESKKVVSYTDNFSRVYINIGLNKGLKKKVRDIVIIGNIVTKKKFIHHVANVKKGDLITPNYILSLQKRLISTSAFKSVRVSPDQSTSEYVDLIINIEEKGSGNYEIIPGIRTDIGPKVQLGMNFFNLGGVNRTLNMSIQTNQRIDLTSIDSVRRDTNKSLLEGTFKLDYTEPFIGWTDYNYSFSLSLSRLRYFSFDADIQRIVNSIQTNYNDNWSMSLKLKNEKINQFNGSEDIDEGQFIVGALLPGLVADFRDSRVKPMNGSYHELTVEYATPFLGSSDDISFATTISKNRVYIPMGKLFTLALSGTMGVQKNLISNGSIPSIKVFRLRGLETVRGFEEGEINILTNGNDINDEIVNDTAYMANFKLEPRYLLTDNLMVGVFLDAGRVFYEKLELSEMRRSVGISFKYLTPVGSINFDYGHKLLREETSSGTLESPGRFHISIGFF